jgi:type I restriction enzyme, S subunit
VIGDLKPYAAYKDSGQDWIGPVPAHWNLLRAKRLFREVDERSKTGKEELLSVSHLTGVTPRRLKNVTMFMAESNVGHKVCRPGDLVINTLWAWMAALGVSRDVGIVSPAYGVYRPIGAEMLPSYADYLLRTPLYAAEYQRRSTGVNSSRLRLYPEQFLRVPLLVPSREEQALIVRLLQWVNGRLDRAIRGKRGAIALLAEQKRAIITRAVASGLKRDVQRVPTGDPWITELPEHWALLQVRRLISLVTSGSRGWANYYSDDGLIFLQSGNLGRSMSLNLDTIQHVRPPGGAEGERTRVKEADVLICITGALTGNVALVDQELPAPAYVNQHVALVRPKLQMIRPRFLAYVLHSEIGQAQFKTSEYGGTKQGLGLGDVKSVRVPVPPLDEQEGICSFLDTETAKFDSAADRLRHEIELLREYRSRVSSDVVMGRIDVREAAARAPNDIGLVKADRYSNRIDLIDEEATEA